jgi:uncharacterized membrane protein
MRRMDPTPTSPVPPPPSAQPQVIDVPAKVVYGLYLAAFLVAGVSSLVGVVIAYVYQGEAPEALRTHYRFQIRTFWIGLLYGVVSALLVFAFIGWLGFLFIAVWTIVRCIKGFQRLSQHQPIPDPATWLW